MTGHNAKAIGNTVFLVSGILKMSGDVPHTSVALADLTERCKTYLEDLEKL